MKNSFKKLRSFNQTDPKKEDPNNQIRKMKTP